MIVFYASPPDSRWRVHQRTSAETNTAGGVEAARRTGA
jgi:hypothetical protein